MMSKIDSVNIYQPKIQRVQRQAEELYPKSSKLGKGVNNNPSFGSASGSPEAYEEFGKKVLQKTEGVINKRLGWSGKLFQGLTDTQGEVQNQLLSNLFTATLAPAVIAWNPISKDDQKTKSYMAWRQPLSAVIALAGGWPLTMWTNSLIDKWGSNGVISTLDIRMCPDKAGGDYLKSQFGKHLRKAKKAGKLEEFLAECNKNNKNNPLDEKGNLFKSKGHPTSEYKKACYEGYKEKLKNESKKIFVPLYGEKPENIVFQDGVISLKGADGKLTELGKNVSGFETEAALKSFLKDNNVYNISMRDFMKNEFKFEFFNDNQLKPSIVDGHLDKSLAMDFMRKIGLYAGESEADLKEMMYRVRGTKLENGLTMSFSNGAWKSDGAKHAADAISQAVARGSQWEVGQAASYTEAVSLKQLFHNLGLRIKDGSLQKLMDMNMAEAQLEIAKRIKGKGINGFDAKTVKDFAQNVLSTRASRMGKDFGNYKKYFGIVVNLPILAVTCTALNWVYPRFMETFLPNLSNAKKGGNK